MVSKGKNDQTNTVFQNSDVMATKTGERHLGTSIGTGVFKDAFIKNAVDGWVIEIMRLSDYAKVEPQAASTSLTVSKKD